MGGGPTAPHGGNEGGEGARSVTCERQRRAGPGVGQRNRGKPACGGK
jgi:hypothetical protein